MALPQQQMKGVSIWHKELTCLVYDEPLPAPIPAVQAVICAMREERLHQFIQEQDLVALADVDEEGHCAPLLLTIDLSDWTQLFVLAGNKPDAGLARLRSAHSKLAEILEKDSVDLLAAERNIPVLEKVLRHANSNGAVISTGYKIEDSSSVDEGHPLLASLSLSSAEQAALEDFSYTLLATSTDGRHLIPRKSGKRTAIPLAPSRSIEQLLMFQGHKPRKLACMNHLAPISMEMWQTWSRLTDQDVQECKKHAFNNTGQIRGAVSLPHLFSLSTFDQTKCSSPLVKLHTKQELPTGEFRKERHVAEFWNCGRPYLRCSCNSQTSNDGSCDGSVVGPCGVVHDQ